MSDIQHWSKDIDQIESRVASGQFNAARTFTIMRQIIEAREQRIKELELEKDEMYLSGQNDALRQRIKELEAQLAKRPTKDEGRCECFKQGLQYHDIDCVDI